MDFILTDPPYLVNYRSRDGQRVQNDNNSAWLKPSFAEMARVLKPGRFCVSFYGWNRIELFAEAWREAGLRMVGHVVFRKRYASSQRFLRYHHECAYLLAKGNVTPPDDALPDVIDWRYTGNKLHPTQKPVDSLKPLISSFTAAGELVLDPFCGSGSTLVAARELNRHGARCEALSDRDEPVSATSGCLTRSVGPGSASPGPGHHGPAPAPVLNPHRVISAQATA